MATNDFEIKIDTDNYDEFLYDGEPSSLPGSPTLDENGHLVIPSNDWFSPGAIDNSMMDKDENNTGPTTDFWTAFPITIDVNGYIFYYGENTGINVRGPAGGTKVVRWEDLTEEEKASLKGEKGEDGINGINGIDGANGINGKGAYEQWLDMMGYDASEHPISEFYQYIANMSSQIIGIGTGNGSIILNYLGTQGDASGAGSTSIGYQTSATTSNSVAMGDHTTTAAANQVVLGSYNEAKPNTLFEIGNGTSEIARSNAFEITSQGNLIALGEIIDGQNNILSNKVDKINGKSLSTNDFTNELKTSVENFANRTWIDSSLISSSTNAVENRAVYLAIEDLRQSAASSKPQQGPTTADVDFPMLYPATNTTGDLTQAYYSTSFTWNPNKNILKTGGTVTHTGSIALGTDLTSAAANQILLGKFNEPSATDVFQIGNGISSYSRSNLLTLSSLGELKVSKDVIVNEVKDGEILIHKLTNKQNKLTFASEISTSDTGVATANLIYDFLNTHQAFTDSSDQITDFRVTDFMDNYSNYTDENDANITAINEQLEFIGNPRELIDDTTGDVYIIGIDNGEFYIKLKEEEEEGGNGE